MAMAKESEEPKKASSIENRKSEHKLASLEIEVHHGQKGEVTGHTVHHRFMPKKQGKSGAFMEVPERASYSFDGKGSSSSHGHMLEHIGEHLPHISASKGMIEKENKEGEGDDEHIDGNAG